ncbi:hypothetical protein [Streptomyces sp. enrichment culture]
MPNPLQSMAQQTTPYVMAVCCAIDVINGSGVKVRPMGARAICAELEN